MQTITYTPKNLIRVLIFLINQHSEVLLKKYGNKAIIFQ